MPTEPELQGFVVDWREKLQPMSDALPPIKPPDHILPALISNIPIAKNDDIGTEGSLVKQNNSSIQNGNALAVTSVGIAPVNEAESLSNSHYTESGYQSAAGVTDQSRFETTLHSDTQSDVQNKTNLNVDASASELADGTAFMRMLENWDGWVWTMLRPKLKPIDWNPLLMALVL